MTLYGKKFHALHDREIDPTTISEYLELEEWDQARRHIHAVNNSRKPKAHIRINTLGLRLATMIKRDLGIQTFPAVERLYPGHWQRSSGAWLWAMESRCGQVGSTTPATILVTVKKLIRIGEDIMEEA